MDRKFRILAVDDSTVNLASIEQELRGKYEVITVNSGMRALRYLNKEKPDLILLDVQMALKDGIETLKDIRAMENGASIPVIMLTSKKDKDTILESTKLGIYDYVLKPFNTQDLQDRIVRTLKRAGVIPVDDIELYENIKEVQRELRARNDKNAIMKLDVILNFRLDEEIYGRLQTARSRLAEGDGDTARRLVSRVLKMLEINMGSGEFAKPAISVGKMNACLYNILKDLESFKVKEAAQKLEDLLQYDLPSVVCENCEDAQERLKEFDDGAAEELVREALRKLKSAE